MEKHLEESWQVDRSFEGDLEVAPGSVTSPLQSAQLKPNGHNQRYHVRDHYEKHLHINEGETAINLDDVQNWDDRVQVGTDPVLGQPIWAPAIVSGAIQLQFFANFYRLTLQLGANGLVSHDADYTSDLAVSKSSGTEDISLPMGAGIEGFDGLPVEKAIPADSRELSGSKNMTLKCTINNLPGTVDVTFEWQLVRQKTRDTGGRN